MGDEVKSISEVNTGCISLMRVTKSRIVINLLNCRFVSGEAMSVGIKFIVIKT
jgi:hypothetical protein